MKKAKVSFDSVIIPQEKKDQIDAAISQLKYHELIFEKWGFEEVFEKGTAVSMIFYGEPGTGKTLMAEAIANKLNQELLIISPAEIETQVPGGAERNIKRYFKIAGGKMGAPTGETDPRSGEPILGPKKHHVMLFDECDSLISARGNVGMILAGQINTLLTEMERFEGVIIFTTNRLGVLDEAIERRLTTKVEFDAPTAELRKKIWERMIPKKAPIAKDVDLEAIAEIELTGGNIKNAMLNAARIAAYAEQKEIDQASFLEAIYKEIEARKSFKKAMKKVEESRGERINIADLIKGRDGLEKKKEKVMVKGSTRE